jgi:hypothetical protein
MGGKTIEIGNAIGFSGGLGLLDSQIGEHMSNSFEVSWMR